MHNTMTGRRANSIQLIKYNYHLYYFFSSPVDKTTAGIISGSAANQQHS